jgi:methylated-DNA-[protein]-cysteine S-methyltransferase
MSSFTRVPSPIGDLLLGSDEQGLRELRFPAGTRPRTDRGAARTTGTRTGSASSLAESSVQFVAEASTQSLAEASAQLTAYFDGARRNFELSLVLAGSPFFVRVWEAVRAIPFGETRAYGELAAAIGHPGAARAVGLANGRNPLPIIIPCHRLIGADGSLTGYGGGLPRKRWLLEHEARVVANA